MLVLSRMRDQDIVIDIPPGVTGQIVVKVVDIRGDQVRLGIQAPVAIPVHRREVYEAIQRENLRSKGIDPAAQSNREEPAATH
jgi:carbon storage regulator